MYITEMMNHQVEVGKNEGKLKSEYWNYAFLFCLYCEMGAIKQILNLSASLMVFSKVFPFSWLCIIVLKLNQFYGIQLYASNF